MIEANTDEPANLTEELNFEMTMTITNDISSCQKNIVPDTISPDFDNKETTINFARTSSSQWINSSYILSNKVPHRTDVELLSLDPHLGDLQANSIDVSDLLFSLSQSGQILLIIY